MTSLRLRLFLVMFASGATSATLGLSAWHSYDSFKKHRTQLESSHDLRTLLTEFQRTGQLNSRNALPQLRQLIDQTTPPSRQSELVRAFKGVESGGVRPLQTSVPVLIKNETEFQRYTRGQIEYLENRILYFLSLAVASLALGFVFVQIFLSFAVIRPLQDLGRKMVDFMNDRYTYQFSVPGSDEIGRMHATFNSLAQRVLSNMHQLRSLDQAKSDFLSIASHELRTPLTSIKGSLSLMRSGIVGPLNEMSENLLSIAEIETDRLIRLINDILDLAKIEAQQVALQPEWSSVDELINTCARSLQGLATQAEVQLSAEGLPTIDAYIDADRIQQVLTNLLSNAIKFSPKGKRVLVNARIDDQQRLVLEVTDQGRGIDPQDQEAIFEKFRQATNAKNPLVKGTGLGLAIAKALVEQHDGEIGVRSIPGQGSTFYFKLPEWRYRNENLKEAAA